VALSPDYGVDLRVMSNEPSFSFEPFKKRTIPVGDDYGTFERAWLQTGDTYLVVLRDERGASRGVLNGLFENAAHAVWVEMCLLRGLAGPLEFYHLFPRYARGLEIEWGLKHILLHQDSGIFRMASWVNPTAQAEQVLFQCLGLSNPQI